MRGMINLTAADGHTCAAYQTLPHASPPAAGLVVVQEIFGVNAHIRDVCDRLTAAGYATLAPALFDRALRGVELDYDAGGVARGRKIREQVGEDGPLADVAAAVARLRPLGRVGIIGFCWGGSLAWLAATRLGVAAAVGYYGGQIAQHLDEKPDCPVLLHFGEKDASIPVADAEAVRAAHPEVAVHLYPAGHGFNCDRRASYHAESAALAGRRTLAFLDSHLARPA